jgi:sugar phosphate isomerase/epimerase
MNKGGIMINKKQISKKYLSRREFFQEAKKGVLAVGCLSLGLNATYKKCEEPAAEIDIPSKTEEKLRVIDMSRVSTCSIALNHLPADKAFQIIAAAGYKKVDVHEKIHLQIFPDFCDPKALKAIADENGLLIANLATYAGGGLYGRKFMYSFHGWEVPHPERFTSTGFSSDDPEGLKTELEQVKRTIDLADFFGARSIRVFPGDDKPESIDKIVPWFKRAADYAAEKKIYMAIENEGSGISGKPELCVKLAEKVGSPYFGILYEPGNLMFDTGTDYRSALEKMKHHIVHCHFKDCKRVGGTYEMQNFGKGTIDFPWIVEQLEAAGYKGDYALEFELHNPPPEEGIKKFRDDFMALFDKAVNV